MDNSIWIPKPQPHTLAPNHVIEQIQSALLEQRLKPGDRLPPEIELASLFSVSRGSVRQAMKALETLGVLTIRPGDGTYVNTSLSEKSFNPLVFAMLISQPSAKTIADARYALERDILELLLGREEQVEEVIPLLEENLDRHRKMLAEKASPEALVKNDLAFHRILSQYCGNMLLQIVYDYIMDAFEGQVVATTSRQRGGDVTIRDHTTIIEALKTRSYAMAKQAAKDTIQNWYSLMECSEFKESDLLQKN